MTRRLAAWVMLVFTASMAVFGVVIYAVTVVEERAEISREATETGEEIAADVASEVLLAMAVAAPVGLVLAAGGAVWVARRAVAPVRDLARSAAGVTAERLDRRLPVPATNDELRDLALALNGLLGRLEDGFREQGAFVADAAHELRTPLAAIAGELEVALRHPRSAGEWTAVAERVLGDVGRLSHLAVALLQLRRAQIVRATPEATADLAVVLDDVLGRAAEAARAAGVVLEAPARLPARPVAGQADDLAVALGNVVANALRASPRGGTVRLRVEGRGDDELRLSIEDDGDGVPPGDEERIFQPFTRGRDAADDGGLGLGLAIARRLVEGSGGSLRCDGGARFTFALRLR